MIEWLAGIGTSIIVVGAFFLLVVAHLLIMRQDYVDTKKRETVFQNIWEVRFLTTKKQMRELELSLVYEGEAERPDESDDNPYAAYQEYASRLWAESPAFEKSREQEAAVSRLVSLIYEKMHKKDEAK